MAEIKRHGIRDIRYWRDRDREVDFVLGSGESLLAVEVKFRDAPLDPRGLRDLEHFTRRFSPAVRVIVSKNTYRLCDDRTLVVPLRLFLS